MADNTFEIEMTTVVTDHREEEECADFGTFPTIQEFNEGLGGYAIALYVCSGLVVSVLAVQYGSLTAHWIKHVPTSRRPATFWINSVYLVVAVLTMFSVVFPRASVFVWLFYRVYLGLAMGRFVVLTMAYYGGEAAMIEAIGSEQPINFRVVPCCCCLCCPGAGYLTKRRIRFMKGSVYQMPYVQGGALFIMAVLNLAGFARMTGGGFSFLDPNLYLILILATSFCFGIWGMFVFIDIPKRYQVLTDYEYRKKSVLLKLMVVMVNVQGLVIDVCVLYDSVVCTPYISGAAMGAIIKAILNLVESFILGNLAYVFNITTTEHY